MPPGSGGAGGTAGGTGTAGGRGSGAAVQALTADENVELVAMADAFADRIERSLNGIQKHFDGEEKLDYSTSKHQGKKRKVTVKEKNRFVGFFFSGILLKMFISRFLERISEALSLTKSII